jgi:hypothetical protein
MCICRHHPCSRASPNSPSRLDVKSEIRHNKQTNHLPRKRGPPPPCAIPILRSMREGSGAPHTLCSFPRANGPGLLTRSRLFLFRLAGSFLAPRLVLLLRLPSRRRRVPSPLPPLPTAQGSFACFSGSASHPDGGRYDSSSAMAAEGSSTRAPFLLTIC